MKVKPEHTFERVAVPYKVHPSRELHHERHTLVYGVVTTHGTSFSDCVRLMKNRVHSHRK